MNLPGESGIPGRLMRRGALREARRRPWQTGLSVLGIMLGVMLVVAVDLANSSARRAFDLSMAAVSGSLSHQITGGSRGLPDSMFTRLKTELGVRRAAPGLTGEVVVDGRALTLVGVDPFSEATLRRERPGLPPAAHGLGGELLAVLGRDDAVVMSERSAASHGLRAGDEFMLEAGGQAHQARLVGTFASANPAATEGLMFADIAPAQRFLNRLGELDSIDLRVDDAEAGRIRAWLPPRFSLTPAQQRDDTRRQMADAFHVNLLAMSLLSLLVAALLIHNTMTLSVLQRRPVLGILRSLGAEGRQVRTLVLAEAACMGLVGSLAGMAGGLLLGRGLVHLVTRTIDDLYFNLSVNSFLLDPAALVRGLALGIGVSLLAAAGPAREAARTAPVNLRDQVSRERRWQGRLPWVLAVGLGMMALGWVMLLPDYRVLAPDWGWPASVLGSLPAGFVALALVILGFCCLVPPFMAAALALCLRLLPRRLGLAPRMALRAVRQGLSRTGLAVAALAVATSVTVGVGVMVDSFRDTVQLWLDQSLSGDIQVNATREAAIPPSLPARLAALPGVADVEAGHTREVDSESGPLRLRAGPGGPRDSFYLKTGGEDAEAAYRRGEGVLVAEPLAYRRGLDVGDRLALRTDRGAREFRVLGIFYDYTTGPGTVALHEDLYRRWWDAGPADRLTLWAAPGSELRELLSVVRERVAAEGAALSVVSNREIRDLTLRIFDRTFAVTHVLRLLAVLVAFVGVFSALMALQLERLRDYAILRATGMTPAQVGTLVLGQTAVMGVFAGLLALPLGLLMADVLIDVINRRSFGWSMQQSLPVPVLWEAVWLALAAAIAAALYPAWRAARLSPAGALREE